MEFLTVVKNATASILEMYGVPRVIKILHKLRILNAPKNFIARNSWCLEHLKTFQVLMAQKCIHFCCTQDLCFLRQESKILERCQDLLKS